MKQQFYRITNRLMATIVPILLTLLPSSPTMADTPNLAQEVAPAVTVNQLRPRLVRLEKTDAIPDDFKQLVKNTEFYDQTFGWYLHEGDLVVHGDFEADLPLMVRGHLVVSGDMNTKVYHGVPVLVAGDVVAQSISINDGWLNADGNIVTKAVILEDHDSAPSFIGANGLVYTDLLSTYGDSCSATKIVPSAIQLPRWNDYQNLDSLAPQFARRMPEEDPKGPDSYERWDEWKHDGHEEALFKDLLNTLKNNKSIRKADIKLSFPAEVECWQQNTPDETLGTLAEKNDGFARRIALRPWPLSAKLQESLSGHRSVDVRKALTQRRDLTDSVLQKLSRDANSAVKALVARHRPDLVQPLDASAPVEIRLLYAQSDKAPSDTAVKILAKDPDVKVRLALSSQNWLDSVTLQALMFHDEDISVRRNAVRTAFRNKQVGQEEFLKLIADNDKAIRAIAVQTDIWYKDKRFDKRFVIERMLDSSDPVVRSAGASSFIEWPDLAARMAQDPEPEIRRSAATSMFTPPAVLIKLAEDSDFGVRSALADNFLAPTAALDKLVNRELKTWRRSSFFFNKDDEQWNHLVFNLNNHHAISPDTLRKMHKAGIPYFSTSTIEEQPNWPADIVIVYGLRSAREYADDDEIPALDRIEQEAEQQRKAGWTDADKILAMMLESNVHDLESLAATSRFTPPEALRKFVERHDTEEGYEYRLDSIAENPATPTDILLEWVDQGRHIFNMLKNPALPLEVLHRIADVPVPVEEKGTVTSLADDKVEQMPKIVFGEDREIYAGQARTILRARELRGEELTVSADGR